MAPARLLHRVPALLTPCTAQPLPAVAVKRKVNRDVAVKPEEDPKNKAAHLARELQFFERVKARLRNRDLYNEFLKCLNIFTADVVSKMELRGLAYDILSRFPDLLTGFDAPNDGQWSFNGIELAGVPPHKVARLGMVRTFQLTKALFRLTVIENMRLGATKQKGESIWRAVLPFTWKAQERAVTEQADDLLRRFKLDSKREDFAGSLSGGQRKLLEMARALMVGPEMVMLDEPMAGVNPALTQSLLGHIKDLREQGMTVLFVEHDMDMVRDISDWVIVMGQGKIIAEGPPADVMQNAAVIDAYLGSRHDQSLVDDTQTPDSGGSA
jgi:ABC-type branched-subunit amino acid transport system ATPase component